MFTKFKGPALKALVILVGIMILVSAWFVIRHQGEEPDRRNLLVVGIMTVLCMVNVALFNKVKDKKK